MSSASGSSLPVATDKSTPDLFPVPPKVGKGTHNTVFERMLSRAEDEENPVPLVLACLAYYNYKLAKRKWIMDWVEQNNDKPSERDVDYFVSTWNDVNIDQAFAAAGVDIRNFMVEVVDSAKEDISEEVYQSLFRGLSEQITSHTQSSQARAASLSSLVKERTKSNWLLSAFADIIVSVIANFIWFALTIVILIGLYAQFDFGKFLERTKGLFSQQDTSVIQEKNKTNP